MQIEENKSEKIFSRLYPILNSKLFNEGKEVDSRNGMTNELLSNHIEIDPYYSCVGGYNRNMNIFFLIAEALWIYAGRRDVKFLDIFNSNMKNYSDDGKYFHAPYGWRLRNWGISSDFNPEKDDESIHAESEENDQLRSQIINLHNDPATRQSVLSIWNPNLDYPELKTKDRPCNDLLMYKIREGKLYAQISNRSNDLHWGLTTNVFQFSFVGKIIAGILGVIYESQVHNSQSLHSYHIPIFYELEGFYKGLHKLTNPYLGNDLYDYSEGFHFEFKFLEDQSIEEKIKMVDFFIKSMITLLLKINDNMIESFDDSLKEFELNLKRFSPLLYEMFCLLKIYIGYKNHKSRKDSIKQILELIKEEGEDKRGEFFDFELLSLNFFIVRLLKDKGQDYLNNFLNFHFPKDNLVSSEKYFERNTF